MFPAVRGTGAVPEATLSAMGETRAQGPGEEEDRENYAELLMSSAPCSLCSGRCAPCATSPLARPAA